MDVYQESIKLNQEKAKDTINRNLDSILSGKVIAQIESNVSA
jgi:hypothetical protein